MLYQTIDTRGHTVDWFVTPKCTLSVMIKFISTLNINTKKDSMEIKYTYINLTNLTNIACYYVDNILHL